MISTRSSRARALPGVARLVALATVASVSVGCGAFAAPPPPPPQPVHVRVTSEPGEPMAEVALLLDGAEVAKTDAEGIAKLSLSGEDGRPFVLAVACPVGYIPPARPLDLVLRRMDRAPLYEVRCAPDERSLVIAIHAENGAGVPVTYLGKELARTDEEGYALLRLEPKAGESVFLTFDTSGPKHAALRPQNPQVAVPSSEDGAFTIKQKFTVERPATVRRPAAAWVPRAVFAKR